MKTVILMSIMSVLSMNAAYADAGTNMFAGGSAMWYATTMALPTMMNSNNNTAPAPNYYSYDNNGYNNNWSDNSPNYYSGSDGEDENCGCDEGEQ